MNLCILIGRLGKDPETRFTSSGTAVCNFSIATDESFKNRAGEQQKKTEWHRIVIWDKAAEVAQQYLHKGDMVSLEGKIQSREWTDKEGQKKTTVEIVVRPFGLHLLPNSHANGGQPAGEGSAEDTRGAAPEVTDEDIPF